MCVVGNNGVKFVRVYVPREHLVRGSGWARASRRAGGSVVARQMVHGEQAQRHGHDPEQQPQPLSGGDGDPDPYHVFTVPSIDRKPTKSMPHTSTIWSAPAPSAQTLVDRRRRAMPGLAGTEEDAGSPGGEGTASRVNARSSPIENRCRSRSTHKTGFLVCLLFGDSRPSRPMTM